MASGQKLKSRNEAVTLHSQGMSASKVAEHFGISPQVASRWVSPEVDARHKEREKKRYYANREKKLQRERDRVNSTRTQEKKTYFIRSGEFVKIGRTKNIPQRLRKFQEGNPIQVELMATCDLDENILHQQFSHIHHRGEWFHLTAELMQFIGTQCLSN